MLPKRSRLSREAFSASFKGAFRVRGVGFQTLYTPSSTFRAAVVVSKKVAATAVERNRLRRRFYSYFEAFRREEAFLGEFIVMVSPDIKKHPPETVRQSLKTSCEALLSCKPHSR